MRTIFVVDDDADFVDVLTHILDDPSWRVYGFTDPIRALAALTVTPPDLLLVDLWMPRLDGEAFVAAARPRARMAEFLFVTSVDGPAAIEAGERASVPILLKPFSLDAIRHMVARLLA